MKNNPLIHIAFTLLCLMFMTACSSNVKEEIKRAEDLATIAPDSAFAILEDIRKDASPTDANVGDHDGDVSEIKLTERQQVILTPIKKSLQSPPNKCRRLCR